MAIVIMAVGVIATLLFRVDEQGVILLDAVESGLPKIHMFQFAGIDWTQAAGRSLMIAAVIMSETLLSENNFALKLMKIRKFWRVQQEILHRHVWDAVRSMEVFQELQ